MRFFVFVIVIFLIGLNPIIGFAQTHVSGVVNQYTSVLRVLGEQNVKGDSLKVKHPEKFVSGDYVLLLQMKGALLDSSDLQIVKNINNAGKYELLQIEDILSSDSVIVFSSGFLNSYDADEALQLVNVPFSQTSFIVEGPLKAYPWDGEKGGVVALMAHQGIALHADIDVTGVGFRGADPPDVLYNGPCASNNSAYQKRYYGENGADTAGKKGEGIVSTTHSLEYGMGRAVNGGGGGNGMYSGGYGGGNASYGGLGGYEHEGCTQWEWIGIKNAIIPGYYNNNENRIFFGGGGGSGTQKELKGATSGGDGGGIVILITRNLHGNGHSIISNGEHVTDTAENAGAGGGGAGGTVLLDVDNASNIHVVAQGGTGGVVGNPSVCNGPGGGGGGGLLWHSGDQLSQQFDGSISLEGGAAGHTQVCGNYGATSANKGDTLDGLILPLNGFLFNYIRNSQTICQHHYPDSIYGSSPKGGNGTYTYIWKKRTDSSDWDTAKGGTFDQRHYTFTEPLEDTVYLKRYVRSAGLMDTTSGVIQVNVVSSIENNHINASQHICEGVSPDTLKGSLPSGGNLSYSYTWEDSTQSDGWTSSEGIEHKKHYVPGQLFDTTFYRRKVRSGPCVTYSDTVTVFVLPSIQQNTISSSHYVCEGETADTLYGSSSLEGGGKAYSFIWEETPDKVHWDTMSVNKQNETPEEVSDTMYYRRIVVSGPQGCCKDTTDIWPVYHLPSITHNVINLDTSAVCRYDSLGVPINGTSPKNGGGTGSYVFNWLYSHDSTNWYSLADKKDQSIQPPPVTEETFYRRAVKSYACVDTSNTAKAEVYDLPSASLHKRDTQLCSNDSIKLDIQIEGEAPPYSIQYTDGFSSTMVVSSQDHSKSEVVAPSAADSVRKYRYKIIQLTDSIGCEAPDSNLNGTVQANVFGYPEPDAGVDTEVCDSITRLNAANGSARGVWSTISGPGTVFFTDSTNFDTKVRLSPFKPGDYQFEWKETNWQCSAEDTVNVEFYDLPSVDAGADIVLQFDSDTTLNANKLTEKETGNWHIESGKANFEDRNDPNTYVSGLSIQQVNTLRWTVQKGVCPAISDRVNINIEEVFIPSGFSPNGDNVNDCFVIKGLKNAESNHLMIFNRMGKIVYETKNYQNDWKGKYASGEDVPEGTYYYVLHLRGRFERKKSGYIIIKRSSGTVK